MEDLPVRWRLPLAVLVAVATVACGQSTIQGSLGALIDLTYQDVKLGFAGSR